MKYVILFYILTQHSEYTTFEWNKPNSEYRKYFYVK